ncbi:MAG: zinc ribbon domain-containing protein [Desulfurococcales archaeon]|jgi:transposase|nr:zinc ribbon domain-containing protein [Desulfurococcales archaeon]
MGYRRIGKRIDWQAEKHGVPHVKVDPNGTSSECPRCGFEADRDTIRKLNIRKRALKILGISGDL